MGGPHRAGSWSAFHAGKSMKRILTAVALMGVVVSAPALARAQGGMAMGSGMGMAMNDKDIVETAIAAGTFNTLAKALRETGLVATLKGAGPFTVFAPTDAAFAKLPADQLKALMRDKTKLRALLMYHVVPGNMSAAQVMAMTDATTAQGGMIAIKMDGSHMMLNGMTMVTSADIKAKNGVIHVIDTVLMPPDAMGGMGAMKH
jgi:uncharacterized surface protein with fasciclin (FAS1) repeats